ncbi:MAG: hypothetical protein ACTSQO_05945 [Candidatus Helarchaeota archaeon]
MSKINKIKNKTNILLKESQMKRKIANSKIRRDIIIFLGKEGISYVNEIARKVNTSSTNISSYLNEFIDWNLVEEIKSEDSRLRQITLTNKGRELYELLIPQKISFRITNLLEFGKEIYVLKGNLTVVSNLHLPLEVREGNIRLTYNYIPGNILLLLIKAMSYSLAPNHNIDVCTRNMTFDIKPCGNCSLCKFFGTNFRMRNSANVGISFSDSLPTERNIKSILYQKNLNKHSLVEEQFIQSGSTFNFEMTLIKYDKQILKLILNSLKAFEIIGIETINKDAYGKFRVDLIEIYRYSTTNLFNPQKVEVNNFINEIMN